MSLYQTSVAAAELISDYMAPPRGRMSAFCARKKEKVIPCLFTKPLKLTALETTTSLS